MGQKARLKKNRNSVKGIAIRRNDTQNLQVKKYGNVTSVEVKSGGKKKNGNKKKQVR